MSKQSVAGKITASVPRGEASGKSNLDLEPTSPRGLLLASKQGLPTATRIVKVVA